MRSLVIIRFVVSSLLLAACAQTDNDGVSDSAAASRPDSMANMPGMGAGPGGSVADQMQAHMRMMEGAGADSMKAMLSRHRQTAANLIATFTKEMRDMNMSADAAWTATIDSLRADLRTMADLTPAQLEARMPAHKARLERLMQMHQTMMKSMKM